MLADNGIQFTTPGAGGSAVPLVTASRLIKEAEPTAAIIDSQSVKTTASGGPHGYDAGKKIKGRKRHIVTDTAGNMLEGIVHKALHP